MPKQEDTVEGQQAWAKADSDGFVAELILCAVEKTGVEVFVHDWMKLRAAK